VKLPNKKSRALRPSSRKPNVARRLARPHQPNRRPLLRSKGGQATVTSPVAETAPVIDTANRPQRKEGLLLHSPDPFPGETKEQKLARLQAVVAGSPNAAKRQRNCAGQYSGCAAKAESSQSVTASPAVEIAAAEARLLLRSRRRRWNRRLLRLPGPFPERLKEQKIARLQAVVAAAKSKAGKVRRVRNTRGTGKEEF